MQEKEIGKITHYFGKIGVGIIELTDSLKAGDTIHVKGHSDDFTQKIESMQIEHDTVTEAKAGEAVGIKVTNRVHENDVVYKVIE
jgi:putative protease